jgi:PAS domain S-box-containing protein
MASSHALDASPPTAVLGALLRLPRTLAEQPDTARAAATMAEALGAVPGLAGAHLWVGSRVLPEEPAYAEARARLGDTSGRADGFSLPELPATRCVRLAAAGEQVGFLILTVSDEAAFAPWAEAVGDAAHGIAAALAAQQRAARIAVLEQRLEQADEDLGRRLAEREAELGTLWRAIEQAPVSVMITDPRGAIEYVNPAFSRITGYAADEVLGRNPRVLKSGEMTADVYRELWTTIRAGAEWRGEFRNLKKNGESYWERGSILPILDAAGTVTHFLAMREDVTERKIAEEKLTELAAELEQRVLERTAELSRAARAKDEFLATMSHELRTPLNAVLGFSEALQEGVYGPIVERQGAALRRIEESGRHLLSLINDILDVSKIESGRMAIEIAPVRVEEICRACMQMIQGLARTKRQEVTFTVHEGVPQMYADERRLKQILVNLLSNAVKFTPDGGSVGLVVNAGEAHGTVRFTVWDTGVGIAQENLPRLFKPFAQLDSTLARQHAGTGLGLALVRRLSELHGGTVGVESEPGKGSRFSVTLPRRPSVVPPPLATPPFGLLATARRAPTPPPPRPAARRRARVLLAEDDPLNVATVIDFLRARGYDVVTAGSGQEALDRAREIPPDIVLMDVQMPGMSGLTAMERLRTDAAPALRAVPIVALTALAMRGDRERCLAAGANEYLTKPVSLKQLAATIESLVAPGSAFSR